MLRVGTPRTEAPPPAAPTLIQLPSAPPMTPRTQILRIGTPRATETVHRRSPTPERRSHTPPAATLITLPGQRPQPARSQTIRVGGTPVPPTPMPMSPPPVEHPPPPPSIIQLGGGLPRETRRGPTIRVGTPAFEPIERPPTSPAIIQLPGQGREPHRSQTIRVGTPAAQPVIERPPTSPAIIQLPGQAREPHRSQTIRVGTPAAQPIIERPPTSPAIIQLPGQAREPHRLHTIRVGTPAAPPIIERPPTAPTVIQLPGQRETHRAQTLRVGSPMRREFSPSPTPGGHAPSIIQIPGVGQSFAPQTVRVASPSPSAPAFPEPTVLRLQERDEERRGPTRTHTVRVGSPTPVRLPPSIIQLPGGHAPLERVPTSLVRVGGALRPASPIEREPSSPRYIQPAEQIIRIPGTQTPQPPSTPAFIRVGGRPTMVSETPRAPSPSPLPPPTMIQLPGTSRAEGLRSPTVRVTAPSTGTPAPSFAPPGPSIIHLPTPASPSQRYVRVPEGAAGGLTEVPGALGSPGGLVRVERQDRTPTIIQVSSPGPTSQYVRATSASPGAPVPGFVRRGAGTPGLPRIPELVHVGGHTPIPGGSRTSFDRPHSDVYPEHGAPSIASVGREHIRVPIPSRSSMAGESIADTLDRAARDIDEEATQRNRRRNVGAYEDQEARRQKQFEDFLEAQRLENDRLRETFLQMAPGWRRSGAAADGAEGSPVSQIVTEAVEAIKSHRDADRASILSHRDDETRRDLENERARVRELEAELARMREQLDIERSGRDVNVQDKCAEMHDAVNNNHQEVRAHLGELTERMMECKDGFSRRDEMDEQRRHEKEARRAQKEAQQMQLQQLLEKMMADQEEERRIADEERRRAAERMSKSCHSILPKSPL